MEKEGWGRCPPPPCKAMENVRKEGSSRLHANRHIFIEVRFKPIRRGSRWICILPSTREERLHLGEKKRMPIDSLNTSFPLSINMNSGQNCEQFFVGNGKCDLSRYMYIYAYHARCIHMYNLLAAVSSLRDAEVERERNGILRIFQFLEIPIFTEVKRETAENSKNVNIAAVHSFCTPCTSPYLTQFVELLFSTSGWPLVLLSAAPGGSVARRCYREHLTAL